jgi:Fic-DOC domain mobile mystery protein B
MTDDVFREPDDAATPLTAEEKKGLIPTYITTRGELNQAEQRNILKAHAWAFQKRRDVLDVDFLRQLHKRMFGEVWRWAGQLRSTERNIGIDAHRISTELRNLIEDVKAQIEYASYPPDEIAGRFHHRLVAIHPFANGNGRHARLAADLLAMQLGQPVFSWGAAADLTAAGDLRTSYITALKSADGRDIAPLLAFMRAVPPVEG